MPPKNSATKSAKRKLPASIGEREEKKKIKYEVQNIRRQKLRARTPEEVKKVQAEKYPDGLKYCSKCGVKHSFYDFKSSKEVFDGLGPCKLTKKKKIMRDRTTEEVLRAKQEGFPLGAKFCDKCEIEYSLDQFRTDKRLIHCVGVCKKSYSEQRSNASKAMRQRSKAEIKSDQEAKYGNELAVATKCCYVCKKDLLLVNFHASLSERDAFRTLCKKCTSDAQKRQIQSLRERSEDEILETQRKLYGEFLEEPKCCSGCETLKHTSEFYDSSRTRDGFFYLCKECNLDRSNGHLALACSIINIIKEYLNCMVCDYDDYRALQFAHLPGTVKLRDLSGKPINPSQLTHRGIQAFFEEVIGKCTLKCACCHVEETYHDQQRARTKAPTEEQKEKKDWVTKEKLRRSRCLDCPRLVEEEKPFIFDFDHRPGVIKTANISAMQANPPYSIADIRNEVFLCDLRCKNCHWIVTSERHTIHKTLKGVFKKSIIDIICLYFK